MRLLTLIAAVCVVCVVPQRGNAAQIEKTRFVNAIIGEAEGECYKGKLAVACAIRNRGTLKGVYGEHSPRVRYHKYSPKVFVDAVRAYEESAKYENCIFIDGADHWEGTKFPAPSWTDHMIVTATIGNQRFYRKMDKVEDMDYGSIWIMKQMKKGEKK